MCNKLFAPFVAHKSQYHRGSWSKNDLFFGMEIAGD